MHPISSSIDHHQCIQYHVHLCQLISVALFINMGWKESVNNLNWGLNKQINVGIYHPARFELCSDTLFRQFPVGRNVLGRILTNGCGAAIYFHMRLRLANPFMIFYLQSLTWYWLYWLNSSSGKRCIFIVMHIFIKILNAFWLWLFSSGKPVPFLFRERGKKKKLKKKTNKC